MPAIIKGDNMKETIIKEVESTEKPLKTYVNKKNKKTTAVLSNAQANAVTHVARRMISTQAGGRITSYDGWFIPMSDLLIMNDTYKGTVTCHEEDTYDEQVGKTEATKKAMDNHNKAFKRAIKRWQTGIMKMARDISPETFDEALKDLSK